MEKREKQKQELAVDSARYSKGGSGVLTTWENAKQFERAYDTGGDDTLDKEWLSVIKAHSEEIWALQHALRSLNEEISSLWTMISALGAVSLAVAIALVVKLLGGF